MASIRKYKSGYIAEIRKKGFYKSKTFASKREAVSWANKTEHDLESFKKIGSKLPFSYAIKKYLKEITPTKKAGDKEALRINKFLDDPISFIAIEDLKPEHFENWADRRMKTVTSSSALREWNILSHICHTCVGKWKLMVESPMTYANRPKEGKARDRIPTEEEIQQIFFVMNYVEFETPKTVAQKVSACWFFALQTALRSKEICNLRWDELTDKTAYIRDTKTSTPRTIPLSPKAKRIVDSMSGVHHELVFGIKPSSLESNFRKYVKRTNIVNLQFRDSRHYALTWMADKLSVMDLAKISGHKDLKILLNTYYNPDIADLSDKLS